MPRGLSDYESNGQIYGTSTARPGLPGALPRLPISQADPFLRSVERLRSRGFLPANFTQGQVAQQFGGILNSRGGLFDPRAYSSVIQDAELAKAAEQIGQPVFDASSSSATKAQYLPTEETEPGGFFALLEYFQVFNYAVAGAFNAVINYAQDEETETNPFVEAWRGFTLQDKETFSNVFRNAGWDSEDTFSYYARGTLGFLTDVVLDPLTYVGLGSLKSATLMTSGVTKKSAFRQGRVQFGNGMKMTPQKMVEHIGLKIAEDIGKEIGEGGLARLSSNPETLLAASRLQSLRGTADDVRQFISGMGFKGMSEEAIQAGYRDTFEQLLKRDVDQQIAQMFHQWGDGYLERTWREAGGDLDNFFSTMGDGEFTKRVAKELLALENLDLTWDNVYRLLQTDPKKGLKYKYLEPGGLKLSVPFTDLEWSLISAPVMDRAKFELREIAGDLWSGIAQRTGKLFAPEKEGLAGVVGRTGAMVGGAAASGTRAALKGMAGIGKLFGSQRSISPELRRMIVEHDAALRQASVRTMHLAQNITLIPDANGPFKKTVLNAAGEEETVAARQISQELNDLVYDALDAEQDDALQWLMDARGRNVDDPMADYVATHIPNLSDRVIAAGFSKEEAKFAQELAEDLQQKFQEVFDLTEANGVEILFMEYYLPMQYKNIEKVKKLVFGDKPIPKDLDPFTLARRLTREQRARVGVEPVKNLSQLTYSRIFAAERALAERRALLDLARKFGVHSEQMQDLMRVIHGPESKFSQEILQTVRRELGFETYKAGEIMRILPELKTFFDSVHTGNFAEAKAWLEVQENSDKISQYLNLKPEDAPSFLEALTESVRVNSAAVRNASNNIVTHYHKLIADTRQELEGPLRALVDQGVSLEVGKALSARVEQRVLQKLGIDSKKSMHVRDFFGEPETLVKLGKDANVDVLRLAMLDEALSAVPAANKVPRELAEHSDKIADQIVDIVRSFSDEAIEGGLSARHAGFDEEIARLTARFYWTEVFETMVKADGRFAMDVPYFGAQVASDAALIRTALAEGDLAKAEELSILFFDNHNNLELIKTVNRRFRERAGLGDLPWGEFSREQRKAFFEDVMTAATRAEENVGVKFFQSPVYKTPNKEVQALIERQQSAFQKWIGKLAGDNKNLFEELRSMQRDVGPLRVGLHFDTSTAISNTISRSYAGKMRAIDIRVQELLKENAPEEVKRALTKVKVTTGGIVRDTAAAPLYLNAITTQVVQSQTKLLVMALDGIAEAGGISANRVQDATKQLTERLFELNRFGQDINQTEAVRGLKAVTEAVRDELVPIFEGIEAGELVRKLFDDHLAAMHRIQTNGQRLVREADAITTRISRLNANPAGIIGDFNPTEVSDTLEAVNALHEKFAQFQEDVGAKARDLFTEVPHPSTLGKEAIDKYLADHPVLGNMSRIFDALRRDLDRMPKELEDKLRKRLAKMIPAARQGAQDAVDELDFAVSGIKNFLETETNKLRAMESVRSGVVGRSIRYVNSLLTFSLGRETNILSKNFKMKDALETLARYDTWRGAADTDQIATAFIGMGIADVYFDVGEFTAKGWKFALEKYATEGPSNAALRGVWESSFANNKSEAYRQILDMFEVMEDGVQMPGTELARTSLEWKATHSLDVQINAPGIERVSRAAGKVVLEDPEITRLLLTDEAGTEFFEAVKKRQSQLLQERRDTSGWINEWGADVFLQSDGVRAAAREMREEATYIQAFEAVARDRIFRNESQTKAITIKFKRYLERQGIANPEREAADLVQALHFNSAMGGEGRELMRQQLVEVGFTEGLIDEALRAFDDNQKLEGFMSKLRKAVDDEYSAQFAALGDVEGLDAISRQGADVPIVTAMRQQIEERLELAKVDPMSLRSYEDTAALADAIQDIDPVKFSDTTDEARELQDALKMVRQGGDVGGDIDYLITELGLLRPGKSAYAKRAQYWLWRMGFVSKDAPRAGALAITPKARTSMIQSIVRFAKDGHVQGRMRTATDAVQEKATALIQQHSEVIQASALGKAELARWDALDFQKNSRAHELRFGLEGDGQFRSIEHLRRYMEYQRLHHESAIMRQVMNKLPSRQERQLLALRTLIHNPGTADEIDVQRLLGLSEGGVVPAQALAKAIDMGVVDWERVRGALPDLISPTSQKTLSKHVGIEIGDVSGQQEFLKSLYDQGVTGIGVKKTVVAEGEEAIPEFFLSNDRLELPGGLATPAALDPAIRELDAYLALASQPNGKIVFAQQPATEFQVAGINRLLKAYVKDEEEAGALLMALTGSSRADRLSVIEAAYVTQNIEQRLMVNMSEGGAPMVKGFRPDAIEKARLQRGLIPEDELGRLDAFAEDVQEVERYDDLVSIDTQIGGNIRQLTDEFGRPIEGLRVARFALESFRDDLLRDSIISNPTALSLLRGFDKLTNAFKTMVTTWFPSFHVRNTFDASIRASFAIGWKALDPKRNKAMWDLVTGQDGVMELAGKTYDYELLRGWFKKFGLDVDYVEKIGNVRVNIPGAADLDPKLFDPRNSKNVFSLFQNANRTVGNVAGSVDNMFRASLFFEGIERGMSPPAAAQWAQKFMFDYAYGLTPAERDVMRRIFPFYTFMRFNIPLALEVMYRQPGLISAIGKARNLITEEQPELEKLMPSYLRSAWSLSPKINGDKLEVWQGRNLLSLEDLGLLTNLAFWRGEDSTPGLMEEAINRMNPLFKIPIELGVGRNFFFDRAILEDEDIANTYLRIPGLDQWLGRRDVRVGDKVYSRVDGVRWHILQQGHFGRIYRALNDLFKPDDLNAAERFAPLLTGIRHASVDLERRTQHMIKVSNFHRADIVRALEQGDWQTAERLVRDADRSDAELRDLEGAFDLIESL